ncbi:hypothetical protein E9993_18155 [Labilibacter sediminis]|nr:hypothetical protein E9993_18155 [Labilibacter sediminis]
MHLTNNFPNTSVQKINVLKMYAIRTLLCLAISLMVIPTMAQDQPGKEKKWKFVAAPYLLFPGMNGDAGIGPLEAGVDVSASDIFSNLDFGAMLYFEAQNDQWAIIFDGLYMNLSKDGRTRILDRKTSVGMDQLGITVTGLYRINSWAEAGLGGRINSIGSSLYIAPGEGGILEGQDRSMNETWFDLIIAARVMTRFNESNWRLGLSTDIGGFGLGSDFAWQIHPFAGYQISKLIEVDVAYRWLGMKYENGSGTDRFLYDIVTSGPEIGILFHF